MMGAVISIAGGEINAIAGESIDSLGGAGIGGGDNASVQEILITGGTVHATGSGRRGRYRWWDEHKL